VVLRMSVRMSKAMPALTSPEDFESPRDCRHWTFVVMLVGMFRIGGFETALTGSKTLVRTLGFHVGFAI